MILVQCPSLPASPLFGLGISSPPEDMLAVLAQGVRLDYALLSKGLVPSLVSCEIISTPPKWSDHAALLLTLQPLTPPPPHPPCALSSSRLFPAQPSIASLFARKRSAAGWVPRLALGLPAAQGACPRPTPRRCS